MSGSSTPIPTDGIFDDADGLVGETNSPDRSGVFGRNDSLRPAVSPGGNGVFGLTVSPGGSGVFGANTHPQEGRGVQGNGPQRGVSGFSKGGTGVVGESELGDGVFGITYGEGHSGIAGIHNGNGHGVYGRAAAPGFAGWFDGDVNITGTMTINGVNLMDAIRAIVGEINRIEGG